MAGLCTLNDSARDGPSCPTFSGGGVSDIYLVMARTGPLGPKGITAFLVEKVGCILPVPADVPHSSRDLSGDYLSSAAAQP
jgi:hypothetical protein